MRHKSLLLAAMLCFAATLSMAQTGPERKPLHQATSLDVLMSSLGLSAEHRHHEAMAVRDAGATPGPESTALVAPVTGDATESAVKTFTVTARQFDFTFSPSPFVVNEGDSVTLNITSVDVTHGFFLEQYATNSAVLQKNKTVTIKFVANVPGSFTYFCTESSCGTGHTNMNGTFIVNAVVADPPAISGISPASGSIIGGLPVTITGANFQSGATVKFGANNGLGVNATSSTSISVNTPAANSPGPVAVTVTNPDSQSGTFSSFTYTLPAPLIGSVTPASGPITGGTPITIGGANFQSGATVTVGGLAATNVTVVSATSITAKTPQGPASEQANVPKDVSVTNPDGQVATRTAAFTYTAPPVTIAAVLPNFGPPAGGTVVTITGAGFTSGVIPSVTFGGVAGTNVSVVDTGTIHATTPAHGPGAVDVVVTIGSASASSFSGFTYATSESRRRLVKR
ncbi:MAG TPA: IPT/TIG domain-containing protein [Thermoanaerobaculia bacterium]|nr:IPT/TIG domain-containing protein [Thermoanaerobaculia bacterium]